MSAEITLAPSDGRISIVELRHLPATMPVPEAGRVFFGLGRDAAYLAADRGELPSIRVGRRRLVITAKLLTMLGLAPEAGDVG